MIYTQINTASQFRDAFIIADRKENFSYQGTELLFEYLESQGQDIELDVIAICCEFAESSVAELIGSYDIAVDFENQGEEEHKEIVRAYLEDNTVVIGETPDGFVYGAF